MGFTSADAQDTTGRTGRSSVFGAPAAAGFVPGSWRSISSAPCS